MTLISIVSHFVKCFMFGLKCPRLGFSFRLKVGGKVQEKQLSFCGVKLNMGWATMLPFWFSVFKANPKDPSVSHSLFGGQEGAFCYILENNSGFGPSVL